MVVAKQFPYPKLTVVNPEEYTARIVRYLVTQLYFVDSFATVSLFLYVEAGCNVYCVVSRHFLFRNETPPYFIDRSDDVAWMLACTLLIFTMQVSSCSVNDQLPNVTHGDNWFCEESCQNKDNTMVFNYLKN